MSVRLFSDSHLYRTGSLKWTGITTASGEPTIGAWVAEMDFGTAPEVADAMKGAIDDGLLGYQPTWLEPRLAGATAEFQKRRFGWDVDASQVRLVASVLPALEATIDHLVRPGAPIIVPTPAYMPFLTIPSKFDHPVIEVPSLRGTRAGGRGWALDLEGIRAGLEAGAGLVILCNPWNPIGRVLREDELRALHDVVADYDANVIGTLGAIAAYEHGDAWQREVKDLIRSNVDLVERALADTPIDFVRPEGTYLTWWGFEGVDLGPLSPAATLRERARIAANEGRTLGADYASWARINLACAPDAASRIVERVLGLL